MTMDSFNQLGMNQKSKSYKRSLNGSHFLGTVRPATVPMTKTNSSLTVSQWNVEGAEPNSASKIKDFYHSLSCKCVECQLD